VGIGKPPENALQAFKFLPVSTQAEDPATTKLKLAMCFAQPSGAYF
jgi:hypothetical protein